MASDKSIKRQIEKTLLELRELSCMLDQNKQISNLIDANSYEAFENNMLEVRTLIEMRLQDQ